MNSGKKHPVMRYGFLIAFSACVFCGCATISGRPTVEIGNASDGMVCEVSIEAGTDKYSFDSVSPHSTSKPQILKAYLGDKTLLSWRETTGTVFSVTIATSNSIPKEFSGRIQFQIDENHAVTLFGLPSGTGGGSDLPWNIPAQWEGSPMIPGFNR